jgi:AcrR family transcriptional regulator
MPYKKQSSERVLRASGARTRSQLLDVAARLFKAHGLAAVTVAQIAQEAGAFPNQITYYFRTKDAMFVEAACREMLHVAQGIEHAATRTKTPETYTDTLVKSVLQSDGLVFFIEALSLAQRQPSLAPLVGRTIERLHAEGARAFSEMVARRGWTLNEPESLVARRYWALVIGVALRDTACGLSPQHSLDEVRALLRLPSSAAPASTPAAPLKLIASKHHA